MTKSRNLTDSELLSEAALAILRNSGKKQWNLRVSRHLSNLAKKVKEGEAKPPTPEANLRIEIWKIHGGSGMMHVIGKKEGQTDKDYGVMSIGEFWTIELRDGWTVVLKEAKP